MILHALINGFGAVISTMILNWVDLEEIYAVLYQMMGIELLENVSPKAVIGFAAFAVFNVMTILFIIAGVILYFLSLKKMFVYVRKEDIPKGQRIKTVFGNCGMILYILIWSAMILYNI